MQVKSNFLLPHLKTQSVKKLLNRQKQCHACKGAKSEVKVQRIKCYFE